MLADNTDVVCSFIFYFFLCIHSELAGWIRFDRVEPNEPGTDSLTDSRAGPVLITLYSMGGRGTLLRKFKGCGLYLPTRSFCVSWIVNNIMMEKRALVGGPLPCGKQENYMSVQDDVR